MKTKFNTNLTFLTPKAQGYVQSLVYWAKPTPSTDQVSWIKNYITHITDLVILKVPKLVRILEFYLDLLPVEFDSLGPTKLFVAYCNLRHV